MINSRVVSGRLKVANFYSREKHCFIFHVKHTIVPWRVVAFAPFYFTKLKAELWDKFCYFVPSKFYLYFVEIFGVVPLKRAYISP